jgi:toxin ParE1/3/4
MRKHASFHELAELELNDAADFYNFKQAGLGPSFISEVQQAVLQIAEHPESCEIARGNARRKVLRRFPYNVIYSITSDRIRILAIASQRRRPFYWRRRT